MDVRGTSFLPRGSASPLIDPPEWRGMAVGAPAGLLGGGVLGALVSGNGALGAGLQGTPAMDRALARGGAMGALGGLLAGVAVGYLVGHVQDEGWTMPGA